MDVFLALSTVKVSARNILLTFFLLLTILAAGCSDSNHSFNEPTTVFATFDTPATVEEVEAWLFDFVARTEQMRADIVTAQSPDWEHHIFPLYDLILDLSAATAYNTQLLTRSPVPEVRALAYVGYVQLPQLRATLTTDAELKEVVERALSQLMPSTPKQQAAADLLADIYASEFLPAEQAAQLEADENLTNISLAYYNNALSKSASATFTAEEFGCLSEDLLSKFPMDSSGDYIYDANSPYIGNLLQSCLDETVRERVHAVYSSKAAAENSLLWPTILQQRLSYAELVGYDDFASMRLSNSILPSSTEVRALIDEVDAITAPAFERLKQRYIEVQASEVGEVPTTVFAWNRSRYYFTVKAQLLTPPLVDPHLLTFPDTFDRMLYLVGKIVGLSFVKTGQLANSWNPDVIEYRVYDQKTNAPVATFLVDPYQLNGITTPASCTNLMSSRLLDSGERQVPVVVLNLGLDKSTTGTTSISTNSYRAFGHELGHALHFMLKLPAASSYQSDFVEIPSMFCQAVVKHPEFLKAVLSSNPDEPLEQLPADFVAQWQYERESPVQICENQRFQLLQSATAIDLTTWQGGMPIDLAEVSKDNLQQYSFAYSSNSQPFYNSPYFIMPGTDTHYYMYVLARVVASDILGVFEASPESIFDQQLGERYRTYILENCGPDSAAAITGFLGREWNYDAYQDWFEGKTQDL